jgi:hypothetical protein
MPRTLSRQLLEQLESAEQTLGVSLAKLCIRARLPVLYVSNMLGVSRMALHTWFRGGNIRSEHQSKIEKFMGLIEDDLQSGVLPKKTLEETKEYAEAFSGRPILPVNKKAEITALKRID